MQLHVQQMLLFSAFEFVAISIKFASCPEITMYITLQQFPARGPKRTYLETTGWEDEQNHLIQFM
jgi:hypothetical protein